MVKLLFIKSFMRRHMSIRAQVPAQPSCFFKAFLSESHVFFEQQWLHIFKTFRILDT